MTAGSSLGVGERHPVADRRIVGRGEGVEPEPARHDSRAVEAVGSADDRRLLVDGDDTGRDGLVDGRVSTWLSRPASACRSASRSAPHD